MTTVLIVVMLCQSIIQCYSFYGRGRAAYKSMSWSTSSRERAKLGKLDSEPPLLLREWPPETGQRDKGSTGKQKGGEAEEWESQQASHSSQERGRKVERERKREREKERERVQEQEAIVDEEEESCPL